MNIYYNKLCLVGKCREILLLYRRRNHVLTAEKQLTDRKDILDHLERELKKRHPPYSIKRKRIGTRPALVVTYNTIEKAKDAEKWVDDNFDA